MPHQPPACETLPPPRQAHAPYRVCLVCLGNICRSPMAEVIMRQALADAGLAAAVSVESAGTGDWHVGEQMFRPAWAELTRRGYDASHHRGRQVQAEWLTDYDLILAMDRTNLADLRRMAPDRESASRIRLMRDFDPALTSDDPYEAEVPDPFGGDQAAYELTFDLVLAAVNGLTQCLAQSLDVPAPQS